MTGPTPLAPCGNAQKANRLGLALLLAVLSAVVWFASPRAALAYSECPSGWSQVTDYQVGEILQFCRQEMAAYPPGAQWLYFVRVPHIAVGQALYQPGGDPNSPWGNPSDPNPQFVKRSVKDWQDYLSGFWGSVMTINGTFFQDTSGSSTSAVSYPVFHDNILVNPPDNGLVDAGNPPGVPFDDATHRRCIGFGGPFSSSQWWNYGFNDWTGVAQSPACGGGSWYRVVGLQPSWFPDGDTEPNPLTMVGTDPGGNLCFLIGGWQRRSTLIPKFSTPGFSCSPQVQLDGGCSTQLSYYDPTSPNRDANDFVHAVEGWGFGPLGCWNRPVPHAITIS